MCAGLYGHARMFCILLKNRFALLMRKVLQKILRECLVLLAKIWRLGSFYSYLSCLLFLLDFQPLKDLNYMVFGSVCSLFTLQRVRNQDFAKGEHANRLIRNILWPINDKNFVIIVIVITFYSPSCLGWEIAEGPFGLRVKLPPARLSTTHGGGFTLSL